MSTPPIVHRTSIPLKRSILHNHNGEPEQLLLIQWMSAVLLCLLIGWNALVDAYLGHEAAYDKEGSFTEYRPTRFRPIGADTLLFLLGMAGGSGTLYNLKRSQDKKTDLERERMRVPVPPAPRPQGAQTYVGAGGVAVVQPQRPVSVDPLDTDPGDPDARI